MTWLLVVFCHGLMAFVLLMPVVFVAACLLSWSVSAHRPSSLSQGSWLEMPACRQGVIDFNYVMCVSVLCVTEYMCVVVFAWQWQSSCFHCLFVRQTAIKRWEQHLLPLFTFQGELSSSRYNYAHQTLGVITWLYPKGTLQLTWTNGKCSSLFFLSYSWFSSWMHH